MVYSPNLPKPVIWVGPARRELKALPGTYRLMYVAKLGKVIYVLAAFQKKAVKGIATPKVLLDRVTDRLRQARAIHQGAPA